MAEAKSPLSEFVEYIVSSIPVGIVTVNTELRIASINPLVERMFGIKEKEYLGKVLRSLVDKAFSRKDTARLITTVKRILKTNDKENIELASDKLKQKTIVNVTTSPLINSAHKLMGATIIFDDTTELKKVQEQVTQTATEAKVKLEEAEEARRVLEAKIKELEEFTDLVVGRELKMIKLKKEIERLKARLERERERRG